MAPNKPSCQLVYVQISMFLVFRPMAHLALLTMQPPPSSEETLRGYFQTGERLYVHTNGLI